jgi:hypothetical protein
MGMSKAAIGVAMIAATTGALVAFAACSSPTPTPTPSDAGTDASDAAIVDAPPDQDAKHEAGGPLHIVTWGLGRAPTYSPAAGGQMSKLRAAIEDEFTMTWDPVDSLDGPLAASAAEGAIFLSYGGFNPISPPLSGPERAALRAFVDAGKFAILITDNDGFGGSSDPVNDSLVAPFGVDAVGTLDVDGGFTACTFAGGHAVGQGVPSMVEYYPGWFGLADAAPSPTVLASNTSGPAVVVFEPKTLGPSAGAVVLFSDSGSFADDVPGNLTPNARTVFLQALHFASGR